MSLSGIFFVFVFVFFLLINNILCPFYSSIWFLFQASDALGELCVLMLVQKLKVLNTLDPFTESLCMQVFFRF